MPLMWTEYRIVANRDFRVGSNEELFNGSEFQFGMMKKLWR
jgi:hypothetical protein